MLDLCEQKILKGRIVGRYLLLDNQNQNAVSDKINSSV